jgi:hypothetical protein
MLEFTRRTAIILGLERLESVEYQQCLEVKEKILETNWQSISDEMNTGGYNSLVPQFLHDQENEILF